MKKILKTKAELLTEAKRLAKIVNDPKFRGDRWSVSMKLSAIQQLLGAMGIDSIEEDEIEEEEK